MSTHNYTTYECEGCNKERSTTYVYEIGPYLQCLACAASFLEKLECDKCQSRQDICRITSSGGVYTKGYICLKCVNKAPTVEQKLGSGELSKIVGNRLRAATQRPAEKFSYWVLRKWAALTEESKKKKEI